MSDSAAWDELPAAARAAVERHTGPVTGTSPGGEGMSTSLRLIMHTGQKMASQPVPLPETLARAIGTAAGTDPALHMAVG